MRPFASERKARGVCDKCGLYYLLRKLKYTTVMGKRTGFRNCPDCFDKEQPLNFLPDAVRAQGADAQALRDPRPETNWDRAIDEAAQAAYEQRVNSPND